jgi:hypothetical protein
MEREGGRERQVERRLFFGLRRRRSVDERSGGGGARARHKA